MNSVRTDFGDQPGMIVEDEEGRKKRNNRAHLFSQLGNLQKRKFLRPKLDDIKPHRG